MIVTIIAALVALVIGGAAGYFIFRYVIKGKYNEMIEAANKEAEVVKEKKLLEVKEKFLNKKAELEKEVQQRNSRIQQNENKLKQREISLNQRQEDLGRRKMEIDQYQQRVDNEKKLLSVKQQELDKMQKQSISMSVLLLADRIATDHIFYDGEYISVQEAESVLVDKSEVSEHERCYHYLLDKINMNRQRFDSTATTEQWGVISGGYAVMYPQAVKELCRQGDYSYKAFLNWADKQGIIQTDGKNQTKPKRIDGKLVRCVFLQLNEFQDEDGFEPADAEQESLPFK